MLHRPTVIALRRLVLLSLLAAVGFACVQLTAAAAPAPATAQATEGYEWRGHRYTVLGALRRDVVSTGADWERFLVRHPAVPRLWELARVRWKGSGFYTRPGIARALRRRGSTYPAWARAHPAAAAVLRRNATVRRASAQDRRVEGANPAARPAAVGGKERIGVSSGGTLPWASDADLARELDGYAAIGATWLRFDLHWSVIERSGKGAYDWSLYDRVVAAATARDLKLLAIVTYTPRWARNAACADSDKCEPARVDDYADFAAAAVRRYAPRGVRHFELWNEPNVTAFWRPAPNAARYTALVRAAYARMKAIDPSITVLAGATAPASDDGPDIDPRTFLRQLYANGGGGSFDAWSHHPYYGPNHPADRYAWSAWYQMYGTKPSLRSLMEANGDGAKKIWATESGALVGVTWSCCGTTTEAAQADLLREALDLWRGYPWAGGFMYYNYHSDQGWSLTRDDWSPRPAWFAYRDSAPRR